MNRALAVSATLHCAAFVVVLTAPAPRGPRWHPPESIAVSLVASVSPSVAEASLAPAEAPSAEPEPVVEVPKDSPKETPKAAPVKEAPKKPAKVPAARTVRPNAPRRPPDDGPTLEERIRQRLSTVPSAAGEAEPAPPAPLPSASSGAGSASTADVQAVDFPYAWYLNVLRTRLTDAWDPPGESLLTGRSKIVLIAFRVSRDGRVDNVTISGASGTPGLDSSARHAVERAQPFPPLPEAYRDATLDVAVRFTVGGNK